MKAKRSSSSSPSFRQLGQLSIFHCRIQEREKKTGGGGKPSAPAVSLLEFLDRKLEKRPEKTVQGNPHSNSSCPGSSTGVSIPRVLSGGPSIKSQQVHLDSAAASAAFQQFKQGGSHNSLLSPNGYLGKAKAESLHTVNTFTSGHVESTPAGEENKRSGPQKRKSSSFGDEVQRSSPSSHLLVLGDDPKPKKKPTMQRWTKENPDFFNHYADGSGWWDTDMVGLDSEEVGSTELWEGMGSTTIGGC